MPVPKKLIKYLDREKVPYEIVEHKIAHTSSDLALTLRINPKQVVKTVVIKINGKVPILSLIPANKRLNEDKLGNAVYNAILDMRGKMARLNNDQHAVPTEWNFPIQDLKGKKFRSEIAGKKWINEKLLGNPGATPPFGRLMRLPTFMDKSFFKENFLILNSGDYRVSIKMKTEDFVRLEMPLSGRISSIGKTQLKLNETAKR